MTGVYREVDLKVAKLPQVLISRNLEILPRDGFASNHMYIAHLSSKINPFNEIERNERTLKPTLVGIDEGSSEIIKKSGDGHCTVRVPT